MANELFQSVFFNEFGWKSFVHIYSVGLLTQWKHMPRTMWRKGVMVDVPPEMNSFLANNRLTNESLNRRRTLMAIEIQMGSPQTPNANKTMNAMQRRFRQNTRLINRTIVEMNYKQIGWQMQFIVGNGDGSWRDESGLWFNWIHLQFHNWSAVMAGLSHQAKKWLQSNWVGHL